MSQSVDQHKSSAPRSVPCAVVTVSDTRTLESDTGGAAVVEHLERAGHKVAFRTIIPDEPHRLESLLEQLRHRDDVAVVLITGGTGISQRDQTFETVSRMLTRQLPGYGELFRMKSYDQVGPAAMLSRAIGGLLDGTVILTMPGSPAAVRLAMEEIILPEIGHLVHEARR